MLTITKEEKDIYFKEITKIKNDLLFGNNDCNDEHKKWITENKHFILPDSYCKDNFYNDTEINTFEYLKCMYYMNKQIEIKKGRCFQFFPLHTKNYYNYIKFNTQSIIEIFSDNNKGKLLKQSGILDIKNKLWNEYFNLKKIKLKGYTFNYEINTDFYGVSILFINNNDIEKNNKVKNIRKEKLKMFTEFKKNHNEEEIEKYLSDKKNESIEKKKIIKTKPKVKEKNLIVKDGEFKYIDNLVKNETERIKLEKLLDDKKIVYCDPGMRSPLFMMGYRNNKNNINYKNEKKIRKFGDYDFFNYTNSTRLKFLKRLECNRLIEKKKNNFTIGNKTLKETESELNEYNSKSCNNNKFMKYIKKKVQIDEKINKVYEDTYFRKLKWYAYLNKRRHEDKLLNLIERKYGKDITIIIGDWNEANRIKFISTPNMHLKRKLNERFNVYLLDEFNTSKLCYKNDTVCGNINVTIKNKHGKNKGKMVNKNLHSVLTFKMEKNVMGCINRDKNSVLNYEKIVKSLIYTKERPEKFKRKELINNKS
jgi:hypothetical protein